MSVHLCLHRARNETYKDWVNLAQVQHRTTTQFTLTSTVYTPPPLIMQFFVSPVRALGVIFALLVAASTVSALPQPTGVVARDGRHCA